MNQVMAPAIFLVVFCFVGFILWLVSAHLRAKVRHRAEIQKELIAKFASPQELADFLNSEAGKLLIRGATDDWIRPKEPPQRPFNEQVGITIAWGVLGLCVGGAIYIVKGLNLPAAIFMAVGIGFLINAGLRVLLTKKWHP